MSDNTTLNTGTTGDTIRTIDRGSAKTEVMQFALTGSDLNAGPVDALLVGVTKGVQTHACLPVQTLKDSGKTRWSLETAASGASSPIAVASATATNPTVVITGDTLVNLMDTKDTTVTTGATTKTITTGKYFKIQAITVTYINGTAGASRVTIRYNSAGTVTNSSAVVATWVVGSSATAATAGLSVMYDLPIPDGLDLGTGGGIGVTVAGLTGSNSNSAANVAFYGATSNVYVCIKGYEY